MSTLVGEHKATGFSRWWLSHGGHPFHPVISPTPGFGCGTCHEYPLFDLHNHEPLTLRQRPLIMMDGSVVNRSNMGLGYSEQALKLMLSYKRTCRKGGGVFTLLWHNSHMSSDAEKSFYRELIK